MHPSKNPFSRRVWKRWAYNKPETADHPSDISNGQAAGENKGKTNFLLYLGILIILLFFVCLAFAGFLYLITHY